VQATRTPTARATLAPPATTTHTTITVWENLSAAQTDQLTRDVAAFQEQFPQYRVNVRHFEGPEDFMTSLAADQITFDVVLAPPFLLSSLWSAGQISPMSDFFPRSFLDGFEAITLLGASHDGVVWGLPDTSGFHLLLFYNQELVDTPPTTTDELTELAEQLTTASQWGLGVNSYDPLWLLPWLTSPDGWLTEENGRSSLDTGSTVAAITLLQGWHNPSTAIAPAESYDEVRTRFLNGQLAMMIDGEWAIDELVNTDQLTPLVLGRYWAVSRSATGTRAQAVAGFLEFISRPERQLAWLSQFGLLPTRRQALDDSLIANDPVWRVSARQLRAGRGLPLGLNANLLLDAMREPLRGAIDGVLTPTEATEMMQTNLER
jgi:arabinogalactan oligomer/maltooligosaccharide transport system substrate-binding protein